LDETAENKFNSKEYTLELASTLKKKSQTQNKAGDALLQSNE